MASRKGRPARSLPLFERLAAPVPETAAGAPALDAGDRAWAANPLHNVVLEASAGTGKTAVLVARYLNLLAAGVDPANVLAITFTRKAAAEMRERIVSQLRREADRSPESHELWRRVRDRLGDIAISTIDSFCLSLLREFPLEADLDPGFGVADETEVARIVEDALDETMRIARGLAASDPDVALVTGTVPHSRLREGLAHLLDRRLVAPAALARFVGQPHTAPTADAALGAAGRAIVDAIGGLPALTAFAEDGPLGSPRFRLLASRVRALAAGGIAEAGALRGALDICRDYFLTQTGEPRKRPYGVRSDECRSAQAWARHIQVVARAAPGVRDALLALRRELNVALGRGVQRLHAVALDRYRRALDAHDAVDFSGALERAVALLGQMDEFSRSRYRLESRYQHVLVDEFQDTSRLQWELVALLVQSWGEGAGLVADAPLPPSIFIVGDRKQSIYRFRDAEVGLLDEASRFIAGLRPAGLPRRAISTSFRAVPELLAFVNDVFAGVEQPPRPDGFSFTERDRFPLDATAATAGDVNRPPLVGPDEPALGLIAAETAEACAEAVAAEAARLVASGTIRDPRTGIRREVRSGDIAVLFRARERHRTFEEALERRGLPAYVYKGLGFFDADEIQDLAALFRFLARPGSRVRAAAFLRSRLVRISDHALLVLDRDVASGLVGDRPGCWSRLGDEDRDVLTRVRASLPGWLNLVDRLPPAEVVDRVLAESAYAWELGGVRRAQARENVKKLRALVRRIQNRGYATLDRLAEHLDRLSAGDESNAVVDAVDAVNLMTVHASKGLEFPIVFLVNLGRGTGGSTPAVRVLSRDEPDLPLVSIDGLDPAADDEERLRDREETKRLLYVAMTRARDRLYLAAQVKDGVFGPRRGSLGEILPSELALRIGDASRRSGGSADVTWTGPSGRTHVFRPCPASPTSSEPIGTGGAPVAVVSELRRPQIRIASRRRGTVAAVETVPDAAGDRSGQGASHPLVGRIVHRLLQGRRAIDEPLEAVERAATALVTADEREEEPSHAGLASRAAAIYRQLRSRDDVRELLDAGHPRFEVPFSMLEPAPGAAPGPPVVLRGVIDLLVRRDSRLVVVEIKTGRRASWHGDQLDLYVRAARHLFPDSQVEGRLVYAIEVDD